METLTRIPVDPATAEVFVHGWQSWSPTTTYRLHERQHQPASERNRVLCYRPEVLDASGATGIRAPGGGAGARNAFRAEGLLAVRPAADAEVIVFAAKGPSAVPSILARVEDHAVVVAADGEVDRSDDGGRDGIPGALARWADVFARTCEVPEIRHAPTTWCSWYHYFAGVTQRDMLENLEAIAAHDLPVDVVQLDDGYQGEVGDWLTLSERFDSVETMVDSIREAGLRAGIWTAPFLVGERSTVAARHPDWLVGGPQQPVDAGHNWGQQLYALDVTQPDAAVWLRDVFGTMTAWGIDFHKIDFLYAGAIPGRRHADVSPVDAHRHGIRMIREAVGDAYVLGCGAPLLPSVGLVDAMRVSPDTGPHYQPTDGDLSQPSVRSAMLTGRARAFQHGRFWVNDPDCLLARPGVERREDWAAHVEGCGGLRSSSDRIAALDDWGMATTRRILGSPPARHLVPS